MEAPSVEISSEYRLNTEHTELAKKEAVEVGVELVRAQKISKK